MNGSVFLLDTLVNVVETALHSACIRDEIPVSLILVGQSGSAKSKIIKSYECPEIHITDSITSAGLWDIVQRDPKNEKRFILIPDINPTLSRRNSTTQATMGNLLSLTGDGTVRIDDGRGEKLCKHSPMGLITACTPEVYHAHAKRWFALGLTRRIIPIFYKYSGTTIDDLQKHVRDGRIHASFGEPQKFSLPPEARPVLGEDTIFEFQLKSVDLAANLGRSQSNSDGVKKWFNREVLPISPHVIIRTLAMAHALRRKVAKVGEPEVEFIKTFVSFTDPRTPRQI
jgi:hypothetical protein